MKKCKLIKKFPKSPEIGTVVSKWRFSDPYPELYADEKNIFFFKAEDVENYPEFWEEIKEKNYEILSFLNTLNNMIYTPCNHERTLYNTHGNFNSGIGERKLDFCLKHYEIYSIKRLSDGEIFTIGDKVQDSLTDKLTGNKVQTINYFYPGDKLICQAESGTTMPLSTIRKVKEPLFTTYDGVEIYEQVRLWTVVKDSLSLVTSTPTGLCKQHVYFAEKENAEKYIRDKEKKYSLNDMVEIANHWAYVKSVTPEKILKYLENDYENKS